MNASDEDARKPADASKTDRDRSSDGHRQLIGTVGLVLPLLLWLVSGWRPTQSLPQWAPLSSVSAYYYTGAVSLFAGALIALALLLFSYGGYENEWGTRDRVAAIIAGAAAVLVAFFPTHAPIDSLVLSWWTPLMGAIHHLSAAVLFGSFIFFCLFQFPKSYKERVEPRTKKWWRNLLFRVCGVAVVACMGWVVVAMRNDAPIFWPEVLALEFFAVSWLAKGRVVKTAVDTARYYKDNPRQLVNDAWNTILGQQDAGPTTSRK